jgi:hypothetical protein
VGGAGSLRGGREAVASSEAEKGWAPAGESAAQSSYRRKVEEGRREVRDRTQMQERSRYPSDWALKAEWASESIGKQVARRKTLKIAKRSEQEPTGKPARYIGLKKKNSASI